MLQTRLPPPSAVRGPATASTRRSPRVLERGAEERAFMTRLQTFLRSGGGAAAPSRLQATPSLHQMYMRVQQLGGYDRVTAAKLWKTVDDAVGNTGSATMARRHYERFV